MTVIAGCTDGRTVWIGADSQGTTDDGRMWPAKKLVRFEVGRTGSAVIGAAGDARLTPITRCLSAPFEPNKHDCADCDGWAQAIAEAFTQLAVEAVPPITGDSGLVEGYALLGYAGRLWCLTTNLATRLTDGFGAIGSGGDLALGGLAIRHGGGQMPLKHLASSDVHDAVASACRHSGDCSPPIDVQTALWPGD